MDSLKDGSRWMDGLIILLTLLKVHMKSKWTLLSFLKTKKKVQDWNWKFGPVLFRYYFSIH